MPKLKLNKTNLNKILHWTNSRYNEYRKPDVIEKILAMAKKGEDIEKTFYTGKTSYLTQSSGVSRSYTFKIKQGKITITEKYRDKQTWKEKQITYTLI